MSNETRQHLVHLRDVQIQRLQILEQQQALSGRSTAPEVVIEINNLRASVARVDAELSVSIAMLPDPVSDFIGRDHEVLQIVQSIRAVAEKGKLAIYCVRGMPGVGKTQVALAAARELVADFPDGQIFLSLRTSAPEAAPPIAILQSIVRTFARETELPDTLEQIQARYRAFLAKRRILILADDARDAMQIKSLLPPVSCALLITTRQRFTVPGMAVLDLETLPEAAAVTMLHEICPRIDDSAQTIAERCGYLPLALRVSAGILANDDTMSVARFLIQLADVRAQLTLLRDPDDPELNVDASLRLSYQALLAHEQEALQQLGVFAASFDHQAALAILQIDGQAVQDVLGALRRRSLLDYDSMRERYSVHNMVRALALNELPSDHLVYERYARYYAQIAQQADALYQQGSVHITAALALFDQEHAHIDAGWDWARQKPPTPVGDEVQICYADAMHYAFGTLRYAASRERLPRFTDALAAARRLNARDAEPQILFSIGLTHASLGANDTAQVFHEQALALAQTLGDRDTEANLLVSLGDLSAHRGDAAQARQYSADGLALAQARKQRLTESRAYVGLGNADAMQQQFAQAITWYEQALRIDQALGSWRSESITLCNLGVAYKNLEDLPRAITYIEQALEIIRALQDPEREAIESWNLGIALLRQGTIEGALAALQPLADYQREIGHPDAARSAEYIAVVRRQQELMRRLLPSTPT